MPGRRRTSDLCELLEVEKPSDPEHYCFERGAKRTGAGRGCADVWKRHNFAWEYKAPHDNLDIALKQLMTYALALDNPPLLVVSDRLKIEIHTHFTGTPTHTDVILLEEIGTPENLQKLRWLFEKPNEFKPQQTRTAITLQAAKLIGDLAWQMQQRKHDPHKVAHFLNKLVFCLFAEDAKGPASEPLLPNRLFSTILASGQKDSVRFERQLKTLFQAMAGPDSVSRRAAIFPLSPRSPPQGGEAVQSPDTHKPGGPPSTPSLATRPSLAAARCAKNWATITQKRCARSMPIRFPAAAPSSAIGSPKRGMQS